MPVGALKSFLVKTAENDMVGKRRVEQTSHTADTVAKGQR